MIHGLNHITLAVQDIDISFGFYRDLLGFKPLCKWDKGAYLLIGDIWLCLSLDKNRIPNQCYTHYAFSVTQEDFSELSETIKSSGVIVFKDNLSEGSSLYFLDPDSHRLEIHVGDWKSRIEAKKNNLGSWQDVEWFV